jgi:4-aminobutyrate aminotransferase/(S)-3-amino-2-methylpropionate transaminase
MGVVRRTEVPGPRSRALLERRRDFVAHGIAHAAPVFAARAHGAMVEDADGNLLLDLSSGIAVTNLGHTPDEVVRAVREQAGALLHTCFSVLPYEGYVAVCERLARLTPGRHPKKTLLANSGAEAVENAVKIARAYTGREAVVCFDHAFHGRTTLALTLTAKLAYKDGFAPFAPEVYRAPFPYAYRSSAADVTEDSFRALDDLVTHHVGRRHTAAIVIEPVLGEGGFVDAPVPFLQRLRRYCTDHGIVLVADEIQTGFGRTGTLFACERYGVVPDLITLAKGLGSGLPISAVTGRAEIMDAPGPGALGGTFGGNPVACAAALAVLDRFEADGGAVLAHARALGEAMRRRLDGWKARYPRVGDVRGLGPMLGVELVRDRATKEPDPEAAAAVAGHALRSGVVVLTAGLWGNVLRLLPPLTLSLDLLSEGLDVIEGGLASLGGGP